MKTFDVISNLFCRLFLFLHRGWLQRCYSIFHNQLYVRLGLYCAHILHSNKYVIFRILLCIGGLLIICESSSFFVLICLTHLSDNF